MWGRVDALLWESNPVNPFRADLAEVPSGRSTRVSDSPRRDLWTACDWGGHRASGRVISGVSGVSGMQKVEASAEWRAEAGNHPGEAIRHRRLKQPTLLTQREAH